MWFSYSYLVVLSGEHLDAHDGEDEPEDETDEEHVEDGRDRLDEGVHNNLTGEGSFRVYSFQEA